jgi:hypothetical protein
LVTKLNDCLSSDNETLRFTAIPVFLIKDAELDIAPFVTSSIEGAFSLPSKEIGGINPYSREFIYYISNASLIGHVVLLLIDKESKEIELFDSSFMQENSFIPNLSEYLIQYLSKNNLLKNYTYYDTLNFCPIPLQEPGKNICGYWVTYWLAARLINEGSRQALANKLISEDRNVLNALINDFIDDLKNGRPGRVIEYEKDEIGTRGRGYKLI